MEWIEREREKGSVTHVTSRQKCGSEMEAINIHPAGFEINFDV